MGAKQKLEAKMQTKWNLGLLYQNAQDPQIARDLKAAQQAYVAFAEKYRGREDYLSDEQALALALADYEKLSDLDLEKPLLYFSYRQSLDSADKEVEAQVNLLSEQASKNGNLIAFFTLALGQIKPEKQEQFLQSKLLAPYRYFLQQIFAESKHFLSEPEEKLLNLLSLPASQLWVQGNEKALASLELRWQGKKIALPEAMGRLSTLPTRERRALGELINESLKSSAHFAESELNALVIGKKIRDELRGYAQPYSATVLGYENEPETVENLVKTVTEHFPLAHRFYKLKAKLLKQKTLVYADRSARVGRVERPIPFPRAVELVRRAFARISSDYSAVLDEFLQNGQIDVLPRKGKHGGAFCSSYGHLPTFILLNHTPDFRSVTTLAHELGHAIHWRLSAAAQPPLYRDHSTATAEVASTLFENFVFDEILPTLSPAERVIALHDKLNDSVSTIFRQIACFNFELELHQTIRARGSLAKEEIAKLMNKHMQAYLGPKFKLTEADGYFFVNWSHLRNFFYVYSYAFGELVSSALYARYQTDNNFEQKIRQFLSAGGSASPEEIFGQIGIDVREPQFFRTGLEKISTDLDRLESLI